MPRTASHRRQECPRVPFAREIEDRAAQPAGLGAALHQPCQLAPRARTGEFRPAWPIRFWQSAKSLDLNPKELSSELAQFLPDLIAARTRWTRSKSAARTG